MKIKTFCQRTGWPYEEFMSLTWTQACEILDLYGLHFQFRFPRKKT